MKFKCTVKEEIEIDVEVETPSFYRFNNNFLFIKNEETAVQVKIDFCGNTGIITGEIYIGTLELYVSKGEKVTANQFRNAMLRAQEIINTSCADTLLPVPELPAVNELFTTQMEAI